MSAAKRALACSFSRHPNGMNRQSSHVHLNWTMVGVGCAVVIARYHMPEKSFYLGTRGRNDATEVEPA